MAQRAFLRIRPSSCASVDKFSIPTTSAPHKALIYDRRRPSLHFLYANGPRALANFYAPGGKLSPMVCLFHDDYGPPDPAFDLGSGSTWVVDANSLRNARNLGEAEAIQRHLLRGETVAWCDQGYAWVDQDAVAWFYFAAFLFVILPYLIVRARAWGKGVSRSNVRAERLARRSGFLG